MRKFKVGERRAFYGTIKSIERFGAVVVLDGGVGVKAVNSMQLMKSKLLRPKRKPLNLQPLFKVLDAFNKNKPVTLWMLKDEVEKLRAEWEKRK